MKFFGIALLFIGLAGVSSAQDFTKITGFAPEIDTNLAGSALALLSGSLLVLRARRTK